ncbi:hypothetical protein TrVE_jg3267 [Triparma verrucosa]|uniref:Myb-like domain-containing protein n=1 Tax=Triparma verrucosa TaxID=1606542 RepID=A0A9W7BCS4_9STRA|nr:hypothetical protein TrVE_jg3267 [Triparma verrucosa]
MGGDDDEGKREAGDDLMKHPPTICGGGCVEKIEKNTGAAGPSKKKKKKEVIHRGLSDQRPPSWSDEELAALRKGVDHYGLDFERIRKEREVLFVNRSVHALECHYRRLEPSKFRGLVTAKTRKGAWTYEEDAAMFKGVDDYGLDFARIKEENKAVLEIRKPKAMEQRYRRIKKQKYKELKKKELQAVMDAVPSSWLIFPAPVLEPVPESVPEPVVHYVEVFHDPQDLLEELRSASTNLCALKKSGGVDVSPTKKRYLTAAEAVQPKRIRPAVVVPSPPLSPSPSSTNPTTDSSTDMVISDEDEDPVPTFDPPVPLNLMYTAMRLINLIELIKSETGVIETNTIEVMSAAEAKFEIEPGVNQSTKSRAISFCEKVLGGTAITEPRRSLNR